jgi:3-hydroxybutyryl-CoA dehydratase
MSAKIDLDDDLIRESMKRIDPGTTTTYTREITRELILAFAKLSGDEHPIHTDPIYAEENSVYGKPIAHGVLLVAFMSTTATLLTEIYEEKIGRPNVSLGYDRLRFVKPVYEGDTITTDISLIELDFDRLRAIFDQKCLNQKGEIVAATRYIMRFL